MVQRFTVNHDDCFIKIIVIGALNLDVSRKVLSELAALAGLPVEYEILADLRESKNVMSFTEIYHLVASFENSGISRSKRIAILSAMENLKKGKFLETCSRNRGYQLSVFTEYEQAYKFVTAK
jgi:hypothetical protein